MLKHYGYLKLIHSSKKSGRLSSTGSEILTSGGHCSSNFQPVLNCFVPKFKLEYDNLENIKTVRVTTVLYKILYQIKQSSVFWDIRYKASRISEEMDGKISIIDHYAKEGGAGVVGPSCSFYHDPLQ